VNRLSHRLGADPEVGQTIVFHSLSGADASPPRCGAADEGGDNLPPCSRPIPAASSQTFIKRVVGVSGDRIALRHGRVVRNGELQAEPSASTGLPAALERHRFGSGPSRISQRTLTMLCARV
jgi:signal peptidase I